MKNRLIQDNLYDADLHSDEHGYYSELPPLTEGSHAPQCDINYIVAQAARGVTEFNSPAVPPQYGDFTGVSDFQTALHQVRQAHDHFMTLPAELRREFDNDPGQLLGFLGDPNNRQRAIELGLIAQPAPQTLVPASALKDSE
jgi:hypothetical protein